MLHNSYISLASFNRFESIHFCLMHSKSSVSLILVLQSTVLWNMISTFSPYLILPTLLSTDQISPFWTLLWPCPRITVFSEFPNHFSGAIHWEQVTVRSTNMTLSLSLTSCSPYPRAFLLGQRNKTKIFHGRRNAASN